MVSTYGVCSQINQFRWAGACYVVGLAIGCEFGFSSHVVWQLSLVRLVHVGGLLSTGYALCLASVEPPSLVDCVCITDPSPFRQVALGSMNGALLLLELIACTYFSPSSSALLQPFSQLLVALEFRSVTNSISKSLALALVRCGACGSSLMC